MKTEKLGKLKNVALSIRPQKDVTITVHAKLNIPRLLTLEEASIGMKPERFAKEDEIFLMEIADYETIKKSLNKKQ